MAHKAIPIGLPGVGRYRRAVLIDVTDPADERLLDFAGLRDAQLRRSDERRFIAEGVKIIERAFAAGCRPRSLLVQPRWLPGVEPLLERWPEVPVYVSTEALIERISGFHVHRGALGSFDRPAEASWEQIAGSRRVIVCEEIVDHANIGAIIRVAAGLGWDAVIVSPGSADPLYRRAIKVSMGTVFSLPWARVDDWATAIPSLRAAGFTVVALALTPDAVGLDDLVAAGVPDKLAIVVGTEGEGLSRRWIEQADAVVSIPMAHGVDSLNVAAATAVACWALR